MRCIQEHDLGPWSLIVQSLVVQRVAVLEAEHLAKTEASLEFQVALNQVEAAAEGKVSRRNVSTAHSRSCEQP